MTRFNGISSTKLTAESVTIEADLTTTNTDLGGLTETAPATDTASSGLNGRLQRVAQRITSLIALVPAALGSAAAASSFAVTASTEDVARQGIITETAPATDTASSGQNGRLQRIAQRITSLIALLPLAIGGTTKAGSLSVTLATDGAVTPVAAATATATQGVLGGGQYNSTILAMTNGQQAGMQFDAAGCVRSQTRGKVITGSDGWGNSSGLVDMYLNSGDAGSGLQRIAGHRYNGAVGTAWDREYGNFDTAALITLSAAAAATTNSADQTNFNGTRVAVVVDITAQATETVVLNIQGKDNASGKYYTILSSASLGSVATTAYQVGPGCPTTANVSIAWMLPRTWRAQIVGSGGGTISLTVGASVIM